MSFKILFVQCFHEEARWISWVGKMTFSRPEINQSACGIHLSHIIITAINRLSVSLYDLAVYLIFTSNFLRIYLIFSACVISPPPSSSGSYTSLTAYCAVTMFAEIELLEINSGWREEGVASGDIGDIEWWHRMVKCWTLTLDNKKY